MEIVNDGQGSVKTEPRQIVRACLRRPIAFHRVFAEIGGGATTGLFLSQLFYWSDVMEESAEKKGETFDGWMYKTQEEWQAETTLTRREQETARRNLRAKNLIDERRAGVPAKLFFKLNWPALLAAIADQGGAPIKDGGKRHTGNDESASPEWRKAPNKNGAKRRYSTESTQESTQETTTTGNVVDSLTSFSVERHSPEYEMLAARLTKLRVSPNRIEYLIDRFPERAAVAADWWEANPEYLATRDKPGAAVASSIEKPDKYPQVYELRSTPEPDALKPKRLTPAKKREKFAAAYDAVWNSLTEKLRADVEREGHDRLEFIEKTYPNQLTDAIKAVEQERAGQSG